MKTTVSIYDFRRAFEECGRTNFSYEGLEVLFDYLEEYEDSGGEEIELDVIALCCDFAESSALDVVNDYSLDIEGLEEDEISDLVRDYLSENTMLCGETDDGNFVYQQF